MKYLITGSNGYIGSRLIDFFLAKRFDFIGTDIGYFDNCSINKINKFKYFKQDLRKFNYDILEGIDCIIHLGALSNDPLGDIDEKITYDINYKSTVRLAEEAKKRKVKRFIFSSSCIMYGSAKKIVDETSPLAPKTAYGKSKELAEKEILDLADNQFCVTSVRNGTIYGYSNNLRFDTVLNNFLGNIYYNNNIIINGNGKTIRPIIHIDDVCQSFIKFSLLNKDLINGMAFNNGHDNCNLRILEMAEIVKKVFSSKIHTLNLNEIDERSYKASFKKIHEVSNRFKFDYNYITNCKNFIKKIKKNNLNKESVFQKEYIRLKWLKYLIEKKKVNNKLELI